MDQGRCELLDGVVVVDAAQGMSTTLIAKFLRELGATVIRAPVAETDPFLDVYPAMRAWRKGFVTPVSEGSSPARWADLAANADVLILGGEDYPGLPRTGGAAEYAARHPRLVAIEVTALPRGMPGPPCVANEVLIQARSGLVWEHYTSRPVRYAFNPATYGATLQGIAAILAGLISRERTGHGQALWTSLFEGALTWAASLWLKTERPMPSARLSPKNPRPLILPCADGGHVHIFLGGPAAAAGLYKVLGLALPERGVHLWLSVDPDDFFGLTEEIAEAVAKWKRDDLVRALSDVNVTARAVLPPGAIWDDAQIVEQGFISRAAGGERVVGALIKAGRGPEATRLPSLPLDAPPLHGLRVVDFGTFVAGPYGGVVLSDLGADVIKVEPKEGDPARGLYRIFSASNRGKRTIQLDMKHPASADIVQKLCLRADGVMSNFRAGVSARRGIDAASLHAKRAGLVVLEAPAYGNTGPRAQEPGFDPSMQAWVGHEYRQGGVGNDPAWTRFTGVDFCAGAIGGIAMLAGLYHRAATGAGQAITSTLVGAGLFLLSELVQTTDGGFTGAPPLDAGQRGLHPAEALYRTQDGWVAVVAADDHAARSMARALELKALADQPREGWRDAAWAELESAFAALTTDEAVSRLHAAGVWVEPCEEGCEPKWLSDTFLQERGIVRHFEHAQMGDTFEIGSLFEMEHCSAGPRRPSPTSGEHSREILAELGYAPTEIDALFAGGVVS